jgi:hypothetical protein
MPGPEPREFQWPDESEFFAVTGECLGERATLREVLAEEIGGSHGLRLELESIRHGFT